MQIVYLKDDNSISRQEIGWLLNASDRFMDTARDRDRICELYFSKAFEDTLLQQGEAVVTNSDDAIEETNANRFCRSMSNFCKRDNELVCFAPIDIADSFSAERLQ